MSYPRYVPHSTGDGKWTDTDINAVVDHVLAGETVSGYLAYPYSFLVRIIGGKYQAISSTGTLTYGGVDDAGTIDGDDAGAVINAAVAACTTGGTVYIKNGVYTTSTGIVGANGVSLIGEGMGPFEDFAKGTVFDYTGAGKAVDFDECRWFRLENMKIYGANGTGTHGLYLGGAHNDATKTKAVTLSNVTIDSFDYGIQGNTFGPDEGTYIHLYVGNCTLGIDNLSNSRFYGGSIYSCTTGMRFGRAAGASADASIVADALTFSGCTTVFDIIGEQSMNILTLTGCWIEGASKVIDTQNSTAGIYLGDISFDNCVIVSDDVFFDLRDRTCRLKVDNGTLYCNGIGAGTILTDGTSGTYQRVRINTSVGRDNITFTNTNSGLKGWESACIPVFDSIAGYQPGAPIGGTYTSIGHSYQWPLTQYQPVIARACWQWNPGSASGRIRFHSTDDFGETTLSAAGNRYDEVTINAADITNMAVGADFDIQMKDDNSTAPTLYMAWIIYEY